MHYKRNLSDLKNIKKNGYKVFTTFACGGGSTMGYKNAGYDVIGHCDIDKQMVDIYKKNHNPKHSFLMGIGELNEMPKEKLPKELFELDIFDGSPPCSTFSTTGLRDKAWGKAKKFREGQATQVLDDLFFDYLNSVEKFRPKIAISENVSGMIKGNAKGYVKLIAKRFDELGYKGQIFLLNGATMGLPQKRERIFFCYHRKEFDLPKLVLDFNEKPIPFKYISDDSDQETRATDVYIEYWGKAKFGESVGKFKSVRKTHPEVVLNTIVASNQGYHHKYTRILNKKELCLGGSFPLDYDFNDVKPGYLIGMSVPPLMMYKISKEIEVQRLDFIK